MQRLLQDLHRIMLGSPAGQKPLSPRKSQPGSICLGEWLPFLLCQPLRYCGSQVHEVAFEKKKGGSGRTEDSGLGEGEAGPLQKAEGGPRARPS